MTYWKRQITQKTIYDMFKLWKSGDLILQPGFQREFVWTRNMIVDLIMCVLNDLDIGKIQLHARPSEGKKNKRTIYDCVDGQQRLTSLFQFLNDEFAIKQAKKASWEEQTGYYIIDGIDVSNQKYSALPEGIQFKIMNYSLDVTEIQTDDDRKVATQYLKLQNAKPLTVQQKREAVASFLNNRLHEMEKHPFFKRVIHRRGTLGGTFRLTLARLFVCEIQNSVARLNEPAVDLLYIQSALGLLPNREVERVARKILSVLDVCNTVFGHSTQEFNPGHVMPIYWMVRQRMIEENISQLNGQASEWWSVYKDQHAGEKRPKWWSTSRHPSYILAACESMYASLNNYLVEGEK